MHFHERRPVGRISEGEWVRQDPFLRDGAKSLVHLRQGVVSPKNQLTSVGGGIIFLMICGNSSVVERNLAKVEVAGSNPVSRSTYPNFRLERAHDKAIDR
jgi:hypothetical protein